MVRPPAPLRATLQRATPALLIALSVAIIMLGKADQGMFAALRIALTDDTAPMLEALSRPFGVVANAAARVRGVVMMYEDNQRLERDNQRLLQWQEVARRLADENTRLRELLHAVPNRTVSFVTARIIGSSGGGFVRTLMTNAGTGVGARRGEAAIAGGGLVGRLTEVGNRASRVLLITDLNSRVPVIVGQTHQSAILAGDNSDRPRLLYTKKPQAIRVGDRVVTSGDGGVFPPGLPVGIVAGVADGAPRVAPFVEFSQLDFVMIVDYGLANGLPDPVPVAARKRHVQPISTDEAGMR